MKARCDVASDDCATIGVSAVSGTARGKVRRIEKYGIIGQKSKKPYKH